MCEATAYLLKNGQEELILKEAAVHGGNIEGMVPEIVFHKLRKKFGFE